MVPRDSSRQPPLPPQHTVCYVIVTWRLSVGEHLSFDEVTCVGVDRKSIDVVSWKMSSYGDAAEFQQRRRTSADRMEQLDWHSRVAGGPRTQVEQTVAGLWHAHRFVDQVDYVRWLAGAGLALAAETKHTCTHTVHSNDQLS